MFVPCPKAEGKFVFVRPGRPCPECGCLIFPGVGRPHFLGTRWHLDDYYGSEFFDPFLNFTTPAEPDGDKPA